MRHSLDVNALLGNKSQYPGLRIPQTLRTNGTLQKYPMEQRDAPQEHYRFRFTARCREREKDIKPALLTLSLTAAPLKLLLRRRGAEEDDEEQSAGTAGEEVPAAPCAPIATDAPANAAIQAIASSPLEARSDGDSFRCESAAYCGAKEAAVKNSTSVSKHFAMADFRWGEKETKQKTGSTV